MACAVLPYSPARFAALRDLGAAAEAFAPTRDAAVSTLTALLTKYGVDDVAGVMLLHAHFDMAAEERLVQRATVRASGLPSARLNATSAHARSAVLGAMRCRQQAKAPSHASAALTALARVRASSKSIEL
jgi:hypothetical protein